MSKIYRTTDRLPVAIGNIEFKISPLSFQQRSEIQSHLQKANAGDMMEAMQGSFLALKYAVKEIKGIETFDGKKYKLLFETDGEKSLTDDCVNDLMNLECFPKISTMSVALINGVPDKAPMEGITLLYNGEKLPN
jgi:hypothetical protein